MEYSYITTYKTHKKDFDRTVGRLPKEFFKSKVVKLALKGGIQSTIQQALEIAEFIVDSVDAGKGQKVEYGIFTANFFFNNEFEVSLKI